MLQEVPIDKIKVPMNNTIKTAELMDQNTMYLDMVNKISKEVANLIYQNQNSTLTTSLTNLLIEATEEKNREHIIIMKQLWVLVVSIIQNPNQKLKIKRYHIASTTSKRTTLITHEPLQSLMMVVVGRIKMMLQGLKVVD